MNIFDDDKEVKKEIFRGRKYEGINKYMNSNYKFCKPRFKKKERRKRVWIMSQAVDMYDDAYGYKKNKAPKGMNFMKNDWFMGPFYSYNQNFENGVKKKMKEDDENDKENFRLFNDPFKVLVDDDSDDNYLYEDNDDLDS